MGKSVKKEVREKNRRSEERGIHKQDVKKIIQKVLDRHSAEIKRPQMPDQTTMPSKASNHHRLRKQDIA